MSKKSKNKSQRGDLNWILVYLQCTDGDFLVQTFKTEEGLLRAVKEKGLCASDYAVIRGDVVKNNV